MTIRRILVPLDGSQLAEAILPAARSLARTLGASLVLLHVLEREPPREVHGEPHLGRADDALAYLEARAAELRRDGLTVEVNVHERPVGDVAAAIDQHVHEYAADLIAMCAHGRSNLRERLLGSVAERILRGGGVPILLRTVREPKATEFEPRIVLVPVDFAHDVDAGLAAARALASAYGAAVVLLTAPARASSAAARLLPAASALARDLERDELQRRLDELADALRPELADVRTIVAEERPAEAIVAAGDSLPADLIVLVTHAHGGVSGWYDPSTGQQLLSRPDLTLLLLKEV